MGGKIVKVCEYCGKEFITRHKSQRFCSRECFAKWESNKNNPAWKGGKIAVRCQNCGKIFYVYPSEIKKGGGKFCSNECKYASRKWRERISRANKGKPAWCVGLTKETDERVRKISEKLKGRKLSDETRKKLSEIAKKQGRNPWKYRKENPSEALKGEKNPFYGKHHTEETLRKIMTSLQKKPNRAEQKLDRLIKTVTDEFEYNGDFRLGISIGGKIPDWVNCNGKKMVIELLGHGWHKPNKWFNVPYSKTEEAIKAHYNKYGWKCLCIWDTELKNEEKVVGRIYEFVRQD